MRNETRRRHILYAGGALAAAALPRIARADAPLLRFSTGGGNGPNEIVTLFFTDWMKQNILKRLNKDYTLEVVTTRGTPEAASLLAAGQVDLATLSFPVFASTLAKDVVPGGLSAIAGQHEDGVAGYASQTFYVLDGSAVTNPSDLKGKTVAVNGFGTATDLQLRMNLKAHGLDPRQDVRVVEISFPNIGAALREKRIDCGVLPLPFGATEAAKGGIHALFTAGDVLPPHAVVFQAACNDILKSQPAAVRAWLADYVEGLHWMYDPANRAKAVDIVADAAKSPRAAVDSYFLTNRDYYRDPNACLTAALLTAPVAAMLKEGLLPGPVDVAAHLDTAFLPFPCGA